MKKTVRILSLTLALFSLFSFVSCGIFEKSKKFTRGTISGDDYISSYMGIKITKPSDWTFLTDDVIAEMVGELSADFDEGEFEKMTEGSFVDAYAASSSAIDNLNINYSKCSESASLKILVANSMPTMEDAFLRYGWTTTIGEQKTKTLGGREFIEVTLDVDVGGAMLHQYSYFSKEGTYVLSVAFTTYSAYTEEDFEAMFSKAD